MHIGGRILETLKDQGKTQKELAQYLNTKQSTIAGWKTPDRNPHSELIIPISEFLGVSPMYLLTGNDNDNPNATRTLPLREQQLLEEFRKLPSDEQLMMIGYIRGVAQKYPANSSSKKTNNSVS